MDLQQTRDHTCCLSVCRAQGWFQLGNSSFPPSFLDTNLSTFGPVTLLSPFWDKIRIFRLAPPVYYATVCRERNLVGNLWVLSKSGNYSLLALLRIFLWNRADNFVMDQRNHRHTFLVQPDERRLENFSGCTLHKVVHCTVRFTRL